MKKVSFLLVTLFLCTQLYSQFEGKAVIRINNPSELDVKKFFTEGYDVALYKPKEFIEVIGDTQFYQELLSKGYGISIQTTEKDLKDNMIAGKSLNGYRTYSDLVTELQQYQANYPGICKLYNIGGSRGKEYLEGGNFNYLNYNHSIWALKVSDNVLTEEDEPCVYYMGAHHAREPISLEVAMYILDHILSNYGTDPEITDNVNNTQIWFMPLVNPNGHKIVTDEDDLWWRKNIRDNNNNGVIDPEYGYSLYPDGVDPNRNYGFEWGGQGTTSNPEDQTYCGPTPFSEPEIYAMKQMINNNHFVTGITYHSHGELVLWPYGYSSGAVAPDVGALAALGTEMGQNIPGLGGGHYTPQAAWQLCPASGVTDDYSYGQHGIFSYTIELATQFIPPVSQIQTICQDNLQAALILLDRINQATLTGNIYDAGNNQPIVAEIYIEGIDNSGAFREPYRSDTAFGRYYRILEPDNYEVTFSKYGYISQTFNNVNINNISQTILDVYLSLALTVSVSGTVTDNNTGLPIENASIE
ncbi:MAG: hypothetical protein K8R53_14590, partial [Bacteroidales bacterium]|nr:hypothetical protein [Bacteroidales bacterium]